MNNRTLRRRAVRRVALGTAALVASTVVGSGVAHSNQGESFGFTPITTNALPCTATGLVQFANDAGNTPVTPVQLMQAGDAATPVNAPATSTKVGRVNDMIALSPDGKYLFTSSENGFPSENGQAPNGSDGITRLTLKGPDAGKKEILLDAVDATGANIWQRVDGVKWYPYGGPGGKGTLLASEEFAAGGIWQVNPETGAYVRLDWLGNYAHEGVGLDAKGNLYLGDENRGGAIYKAVPNDRRDLTKGGTLSYMVGTSIDASGWKQVVDPKQATPEAINGGAILFDRPEDFDEANGRVYFTVTEPKADSDNRKGNYGTTIGDATKNQVVNRGGVYSLNTKGVPDLAIASGVAPYAKLAPMIEVQDPKYTTQAEAQAQQGLQFPDNITFDSHGHLWVHEDVPDSNGTFPASGIDVSKQTRNQQDELYVFVLSKKGDAIVANPATSGPGVSGGYKAADMRSSATAGPCENEFTGGIFDADGERLYINQQHADNPTLTIKLG
jgi:hypothetical protein